MNRIILPLIITLIGYGFASFPIARLMEMKKPFLLFQHGLYLAFALIIPFFTGWIIGKFF